MFLLAFLCGNHCIKINLIPLNSRMLCVLEVLEIFKSMKNITESKTFSDLER